MKRRSFMALPFVAAIAGVAERCFGREVPESTHLVDDWQDDLDKASAFYRDNRAAMDATVELHIKWQGQSHTVSHGMIGMGETLQPQDGCTFPGWQCSFDATFDDLALHNFVRFCNKHIPVELSNGGKRRIHLLIVDE